MGYKLQENRKRFLIATFFLVDRQSFDLYTNKIILDTKMLLLKLLALD